jgi:hypothetical protein
MDSEPYWLVGDLVEKSSGYEYPGIIVSRFKTRDGKIRYVVEHTISRGMLHIFNGSQLRLREDTTRPAIYPSEWDDTEDKGY